MPHDRHLIIFSRYPVAGKTKTRMTPALGSEGAARLQRALSGHTVLTARAAVDALGASLEVRYTGGNRRSMCQWLGDGIPYAPQGDGDLGQRMHGAFEDCFSAGAKATVVIGTDCPGVTPDILDQAFSALDDHDFVLGPATDGGYYLVGLRRPIAQLFTGIDWGTGTVLRQTLAASEKAGVEITWLPPLSDIDTPEDLPVWEAMQPPVLESECRISVIIPALNESAAISAVIDSAQTKAHEIILVDGGSTDDTREVAASKGAIVHRSLAGRGLQMNAGARIAKGDVLLFLHADTVLPENFDEHVRSVIKRPDVAIGAFSLSIAGNAPGLMAISRLATWRSRFASMPFGDQALFVRHDRFRKAGGFANMPLMEDFEFARRMGRQGKIVTVRAAVRTSGRRWEKFGTLRTSLINLRVLTGYCLGESPQRLARHYRS